MSAMRLRKGSGPLRASSRNVSKSTSSDLAWLMTPWTAREGSRFWSKPSSAVIISIEATRVGVVVDREGRAVPEPVGVRAQDAQAGRVEGRDPHLLGGRADQVGHAGAHLARRLVGEGDGQDSPGRRVPGGEQVGDTAGQHARLARAGPGDDQERSAAVLHRGALRQGEIVDQRGRPARRMRPSRWRCAGVGADRRPRPRPWCRPRGRSRHRSAGSPRPQRPLRPRPRRTRSNRRACSPLPGVMVTPTRWSRAASTSRRVPPGSRPPLR